MFSRNRCLLVAIAAACLLGAANAQANLLTSYPPMGDLLRWAAFSLGGGVTSTDVALTGTTDIYGDVGVAGSGNITMTGDATIHGNLYYRSNGTLKMSGNSVITGSRIHNQDSVLDNGVTEAINTSNYYNSLPANYPGYTTGSTSINITGKTNLTLTGAPGQTVVLKLQDFNITSGTLTLQGTASTNFVLNISRQFSMSDHSQIILSGGVTWDNVLFNIRGTGSTVTMSGQSTLRGVLMANNRTVDMSGGSLVLGSVIADKIKLSGGAQINRPPISSP